MCYKGFKYTYIVVLGELVKS